MNDTSTCLTDEQRMRLLTESAALQNTISEWYRRLSAIKLDPTAYRFPDDMSRIIRDAGWKLSAVSRCLAVMDQTLSPEPASDAATVNGIVRILAYEPPTLHLPLPPLTRKINAQTPYGYRPLLREALSKTTSHFSLPAGDKLLAMLFVPPSETSQADLDNYYVKPIIDTLCNAFGIPDCGGQLSLALFSSSASPLKTGVYIRLLAGDTPLCKSSLIQACKQVETTQI